jgi:hypothetical protein
MDVMMGYLFVWDLWIMLGIVGCIMKFSQLFLGIFRSEITMYDDLA